MDGSDLVMVRGDTTETQANRDSSRLAIFVTLLEGCTRYAVLILNFGTPIHW